VEPLAAPSLDDIRDAAERIRGTAMRTPMVPLHGDDGPGEIHLKLENLQPIGSFKLRGAGNAIRSMEPAELREGVVTASAGNMAQGAAWVARELGIPCRVVVPDHAPRAKLDRVERLGGEIVKVPFPEWWRTIVEHRYPGMKGRFLHPVSDPAVVAGNGTIGLEILEDLPDPDAVLIPYGGGGLTSGIAAAVRALRPGTRIVACEVETAAPLAASWAAGEPRKIDYVPSFVDGIGGGSVLAEMWPLVRSLVDDVVTVSLAETERALRLLVERNHVVAEGAGAVPVAAALSGRAGSGKLVCVVSGGNIDLAKLGEILAG